MRSSKFIIILVILVSAATAFVSGFVRNLKTNQEKTRLEHLLSANVEKAVEGTPDPKPSLSFVFASDESIMVVLRWDQKPEALIKNDMRERVTMSVRRELSADPKSWGRHISVIFDNEVVTQGWK